MNMNHDDSNACIRVPEESNIFYIEPGFHQFQVAVLSSTFPPLSQVDRQQVAGWPSGVIWPWWLFAEIWKVISEALIFNIFRCKTTLLLIYFFAKEVLEGGWEGGYNIEILIKIALISLTYSLSNPMTKSFPYNYFALPP